MNREGREGSRSPVRPPSTTIANWLTNLRVASRPLRFQNNSIGPGPMLRLLAPVLLAFGLAGALVAAAPIDREALVTRHNPVVRKIDYDAPLTVGNGGFAFTADITGLQTFP